MNFTKLIPSNNSLLPIVNEKSLCICIIFISFLFGISRIGLSQSEDYGVFLSIFGFVAKGVPLYSGVFEMKDPLFLLFGSLLFSVFGSKGPFLFEIILFPISGYLSYKFARDIYFSQFIALISSIIFVATLSGGFYGTGRSTIFATVLIIATLFTSRKNCFYTTGFLVAMIVGFKMPYILMSISIIIIVFKNNYNKIQNFDILLKIIVGFSIGITTIFSLLLVRGELLPYFDMVIENFRYRNIYLEVIGHTKGLSGHLNTFITYTNFNYYIYVFLSLYSLFLSLFFKNDVEIISLISITCLSLLVLVFLSLSAMWPHHFQILSVYVWAISLLAFNTLSCLFSSVHKKLIIDSKFIQFFYGFIIFSLFLVLLISLNGSKTTFTFFNFNNILNIYTFKWNEAPEVKALDTAYNKNGGDKTFARLGANDDSGFGAFIAKDWHLSCPRAYQYGHESFETANKTILCVKTLPRYVIVSPFFYQLNRSAGTYNEFKKEINLILNDKFTCSPVNEWENARICIRKI